MSTKIDLADVIAHIRDSAEDDPRARYMSFDPISSAFTLALRPVDTAEARWLCSVDARLSAGRTLSEAVAQADALHEVKA